MSDKHSHTTCFYFNRVTEKKVQLVWTFFLSLASE